jgi:tRNA G10  N-methylase Trm11
MPLYLIRLAQSHESFRKVELQALADIAGVNLEFVKYEPDVGHISHAVQVYISIHYIFSNIHSPHTVS